MNRVLLSGVLLVFLGVGCSGSESDRASEAAPPPSERATVSLEGTVVYVDLEGGFYGIRGDDERDYLPLELEERFRQDGLRVRFEARKESVMTAQQWGIPIRIVSISTQ